MRSARITRGLHPSRRRAPLRRSLHHPAQPTSRRDRRAKQPGLPALRQPRYPMPLPRLSPPPRRSLPHSRRLRPLPLPPRPRPEGCPHCAPAQTPGARGEAPPAAYEPAPERRRAQAPRVARRCADQACVERARTRPCARSAASRQSSDPDRSDPCTKLHRARRCARRARRSSGQARRVPRVRAARHRRSRLHLSHARALSVHPLPAPSSAEGARRSRDARQVCCSMRSARGRRAATAASLRACPASRGRVLAPCSSTLRATTGNTRFASSLAASLGRPWRSAYQR